MIQKLYILIPCLIGVRWHVCTPQMFVQPLSPEGLALWIQRYTVGSKSRKTRNFGKLPQKLEFCGVKEKFQRKNCWFYLAFHTDWRCNCFYICTFFSYAMAWWIQRCQRYAGFSRRPKFDCCLDLVHHQAAHSSNLWSIGSNDVRSSFF